jgi:hypothetical protein
MKNAGDKQLYASNEMGWKVRRELIAAKTSETEVATLQLEAVRRTRWQTLQVEDKTIIFHCKSGATTVYVLSDGKNQLEYKDSQPIVEIARMQQPSSIFRRNKPIL